MKITVSQLRRIIKEEVRRSLRESAVTADGVYDELYFKCPIGARDEDAVTQTVEKVAEDLGMDSETLKTILRSEEWKNLLSDRENCIGFDGKMVTLYPI